MADLKLGPPRRAFSIGLMEIVDFLERQAGEQFPLEDGGHYHAYPDLDDRGRLVGITVMECVADQDDGEGDDAEMPEGLGAAIAEAFGADRGPSGAVVQAIAINSRTGEVLNVTNAVRAARDAGPALKEDAAAIKAREAKH